MPTSAACRASASFTPSPRKATSPPLRRWTRTMRAFCSGLTLANTVVVAMAAASCSSSSLSRSAPVSAPPSVRPRSWQTLIATAGLSPVTTFTVMPRPARRANARAASRLGASRKTRKPTSDSPCSSAVVTVLASGAGRVASATTRLPAANSASSAARASAGTSAQRSRTDSGAPLVTSVRTPRPSRTREVVMRRS